MKPIKFNGYNHVYAENQPEYLPLPVYKAMDGRVISCWKLSWKEKFLMFFKGQFWLSVETFNQPLQPLLPEINSPMKTEGGKK